MLTRKERWLTRLRWAALPIIMTGIAMSMTGCILRISVGWVNWWVPTAVNIVIPITINISF